MNARVEERAARRPTARRRLRSRRLVAQGACQARRNGRTVRGVTVVEPRCPTWSSLEPDVAWCFHARDDALRHPAPARRTPRPTRVAP